MEAETLAETIERHREAYRDDPRSITRMVARQPPTTKDGRGLREQEPADANGMNLSGRLIKYLGHPEGYGEDFPWTGALWLLRAWCRKNHRYHRGPEGWDGSLCHKMVRLAVVYELSVVEVGQALDYKGAAMVLRKALEHMDDELARRGRQAAQDGTDVEVHEPPGHRPLPGLHAQECPQCRRLGRMDLAT